MRFWLLILLVLITCSVYGRAKYGRSKGAIFLKYKPFGFMYYRYAVKLMVENSVSFYVTGKMKVATLTDDEPLLIAVNYEPATLIGKREDVAGFEFMIPIVDPQIQVFLMSETGKVLEVFQGDEVLKRTGGLGGIFLKLPFFPVKRGSTWDEMVSSPYGTVKLHYKWYATYRRRIARIRVKVVTDQVVTLGDVWFDFKKGCVVQASYITRLTAAMREKLGGQNFWITSSYTSL